MIIGLNVKHKNINLLVKNLEEKLCCLCFGHNLSHDTKRVIINEKLIIIHWTLLKQKTYAL